MRHLLWLLQGGLLFAKLMVPEAEKTHDAVNMVSVASGEERPVNIIDAAAASSGMQLALNVGVMLLAFVALIALLNCILGVIGGWIHVPGLSLEFILGWIFASIAYLIGMKRRSLARLSGKSWWSMNLLLI